MVTKVWVHDTEDLTEVEDESVLSVQPIESRSLVITCKDGATLTFPDELVLELTTKSIFSATWRDGTLVNRELVRHETSLSCKQAGDWVLVRREPKA